MKRVPTSPCRRTGLLVFLVLTGLSNRCLAQSSTAPPERYAAIVHELEAFIERELTNKDLPALSISLVDDQTTVWAQGFGLANSKDKVPATAETVYRVGSVSKLFTDIGIMQLVERGQLELDAPVSKYLPDFHPANPFNKPITLRQMMAHRSGLVREPPVGHYFDPTNPSLTETVHSLNATELVYEPETRTKYSNAAIATVGFVLETTQREPFVKYLQRSVLDPLGLKRSGFEPTPDLTEDLAKAYLWTYHGRVFEAPAFVLGIAPAGCMVSTTNDLGRFLSVLFAGGRGPGGDVLKPETIQQMWTPQFVKPGEKTGFGIGFSISELDGHRRIGHGGAIYGFATELAALPDEKLGAVVITTKDSANAVTRRIANAALRLMLARRQGKAWSPIEETTPVTPEVARQLAGRYEQNGKGLDLIERNGRLFMLPLRGGTRVELLALSGVGSSRVDLQACKLEYSIVSPK